MRPPQLAPDSSQPARGAQSSSQLARNDCPRVARAPRRLAPVSRPRCDPGCGARLAPARRVRGGGAVGRAARGRAPAGVSLGLKERNSNIKIGIADPDGSALFSYFKNGTLKSSGSSITEGIGQGRITKNLENIMVDFAYNINDSEALEEIYSLIYLEGLSLGTSPGLSPSGVCGA